MALYVDTVRQVTLDEDPSRPVLVSSPSNGPVSEEQGHVASNPQDPLYGDVHFYDYGADAWNWRSYPTPRMATEYGFQALPSVHAWAEAAAAFGGAGDDWHWNGRLLDKRQPPPNGNVELLHQVGQRLGPPRNATAEQQFLDMIFLTQVCACCLVVHQSGNGALPAMG